MKKPILRKTSNPKSVDDYFKMLQIIFDWNARAIEILDTIQNTQEFNDIYSGLEDKVLKEYDTPKKLFHKNIFGYEGGAYKTPALIKDQAKAVIEKFPKNNQIENFLKWYRASLAWDIHLFINEGYLDIDWVKHGLKDGLLTNKDYFDELTPQQFSKVQEKAEYVSKVFKKLETELKPITFKVDKLWINYYNQENLKTRDYEHNDKEQMFNLNTQIISEIEHYVDLYESDKDKYKKLMELNWNDKTPNYVEHEMSVLEETLSQGSDKDEIQYLGNEKTKYEKLLKEEESTTLHYMNIEENLDWYLLETNDSDLESFIGTQGGGAGGHCGRDDSSDVFLSLRSKNSLGQFILHATCSCKIHVIPKNEENKQTDFLKDFPAVFEVVQIKSRRNMPVPAKFWIAVLKLYNEDEFGWQSHVSTYKHENNFNIEWLVGLQSAEGSRSLIHDFGLSDAEEKKFKKIHDKFLKVKPYWNSPNEAKKHYGLKNFVNGFVKYLKEHFRDVIGKKEFEKVEVVTDYVQVYFTYFEEMLSAIKHWDDKFEGYYRSLNDYIYVDAPDLEDDDIQKYIYDIEDYDKKLFKKLNKEVKKKGYESILDMICHDKDKLPVAVMDAINNGNYSGWEVGTNDEYRKEIEKYFDQWEMDSDYGNVGEIKEVSDTDGKIKWVIAFNIKNVEEYCDNNLSDDDYGYPTVYVNRKDSIEYGYEFNDEAAFERFRAELPSAEEEEKA